MKPIDPIAEALQSLNKDSVYVYNDLYPEGDVFRLIDPKGFSRHVRDLTRAMVEDGSWATFKGKLYRREDLVFRVMRVKKGASSAVTRETPIALRLRKADLADKQL